MFSSNLIVVTNMTKCGEIQGVWILLLQTKLQTFWNKLTVSAWMIYFRDRKFLRYCKKWSGWTLITTRLRPPLVFMSFLHVWKRFEPPLHFTQKAKQEKSPLSSHLCENIFNQLYIEEMDMWWTNGNRWRRHFIVNIVNNEECSMEMMQTADNKQIRKREEELTCERIFWEVQWNTE